MRPEDAKTAARVETPRGLPRHWTDADYLTAAAATAMLIAPAPFFWTPPIWVVALIQPMRGWRRPRWRP